MMTTSCSKVCPNSNYNSRPPRIFTTGKRHGIRRSVRKSSLYRQNQQRSRGATYRHHEGTNAAKQIYAPIGGTVDMVMLKTGQAIAPGVPLCNIVNRGQHKITGDVPEAYAAKVKQGLPVQIFFPDLDKEVASRVTYVSKSINPTNRTFTVECALPAGGSDYRANMIAVMKIIDYQNPKAIVVPVNLIQTAEGGEFVLAADARGEGNKATVRKVSITQGRNYNGMVEISSGLKAGDRVISTGFQDVNGGETVLF
ncbi:MAG: efflux RND transporter periplasmic adaptor subunit [Lewinellaceae bacterium]|nr:efflux RND transporter periplasmic adaptor subunit [Lewinellaceae bacterium]